MELSLLFFLGGVSRKVKKKSPGAGSGGLLYCLVFTTDIAAIVP